MACLLRLGFSLKYFSNGFVGKRSEIFYIVQVSTLLCNCNLFDKIQNVTRYNYSCITFAWLFHDIKHEYS